MNLQNVEYKKYISYMLIAYAFSFPIFKVATNPFKVLAILWHENIELTSRCVSKYRHLLIIFIFYSSFDKKYTSQILSAFLAAIFFSELISYAIFFEPIHYKYISPSDPTPFMSHMTYAIGLVISLLIIYTLFKLLIKEKEHKVLSTSFSHNTLHTIDPISTSFFHLLQKQKE